MSQQLQTPVTHVLIKGSFGTFGYNPELECMFHLWKGFLSVDEVKRVAETTNPYIARGITNVIADHRNMEMFSEEVSAYIANTWLPAMEKLGARTTFVVMSPETFTQLSAEEMHETAKSQSSIDIRHFGSMDDALAALRAYNKINGDRRPEERRPEEAYLHGAGIR
ncbi:MAG: hypothetical protein AVDCRST_MAG56-7072 [uncultured Cytophagales bacterium]|uniref:Uncharacterized protein n=1 Tax=uncultured Cytophagales bacterium TaxID=158755 RepID=A0A6J4LC44_9SPHI|nr:MAG: hypothetical protein AVDCRST_MAG56-7072 [uncultured Cytophagales bacterium]